MASEERMDLENELRHIINDLSAGDANRAGSRRARRVGRVDGPIQLPFPTQPPLPEEPHSPTESELELEDIALKASARLKTIKRTPEDFNQETRRRDRKPHQRKGSPRRSVQVDFSHGGSVPTTVYESEKTRHISTSSFFSHYHVNQGSGIQSDRNETEFVDFHRERLAKRERKRTDRELESGACAESFDKEMDVIMSSIAIPEERNDDTSPGMPGIEFGEGGIITEGRSRDEETSQNQQSITRRNGMESSNDGRRKANVKVPKVKVKPRETSSCEPSRNLNQDTLKKRLEDAVELYSQSISDLTAAVDERGDQLSETKTSPSSSRERQRKAQSDSSGKDAEITYGDDSSHLKQVAPCSINTPRSRTPINYQDLKELEDQVQSMSVDNNNDSKDLPKMSYRGRGIKLSSDSAIAMETEDSDYSPPEVIDVDSYYARSGVGKKKNGATQGDIRDKSSSRNRSQKIPSNLARNNVKDTETKKGEKYAASLFQKLDIVGDTSEHRFPWQRDVPTQCDAIEVRSQCTQTSQAPLVEICEKCRARRHCNDGYASSRSPSPKSVLPNKLPMENGISFRNPATVKVQAVRPQVSGSIPEDNSRANSLKVAERNAEQTTTSSKASASRTFSESSINNRFRDMYFRHIQPGQSTKSGERRQTNPSDNLSHEYPDATFRRSQTQRPRLRTAESVDLPIQSTHAQTLEYRSSPSPPVSPADWAKTQNSPMRQSPKVLVTHVDDNESVDSPFPTDSLHSSQESLVSEASSLTVPLPDTLQTRTAYRKESMVKYSSGSENPSDEEDEIRPPPSAFRRRRGAMTSETLRNTLQVENSLPEESEGSRGIESRRPSAHIVSLPSLNISPGDLHVVDGVTIPGLESGTSQVLASYLQGRSEVYDSYQSLTDGQEESKKSSRSSWTLRKTKKEKEKERTSSLEDLSQVLNNIKIKEIDDFDFAKYKGMHWSEFFGLDKTHSPISETELKRREAVWELFKGECVYLLDHLMVLRNVFLESIKDVQCEGHLMFVEPSKLFANLDELCQVTVTFCQLLERLLSNQSNAGDFGRTESIVTAFTTFGSRVSPAYQRYCLNYSGALNYLEHLRKQTDFLDFLKWCEQDPRCNRLQITDLLVAPMQHVTKYPLLLKNIRKKTKDGEEIRSLTSTVHIVETSLREMEGKVKWLTSFERLRELQHLISWPPVEELDTKTFVPEFLKGRLNQLSCSNILASPKRMLLHEGPILLSVENTKSVETYLFLFDDMLLVTKTRKVAKKKTSMTDGLAMLSLSLQSIPHKKDGIYFTVYKQPIPLDRLELVEIEPQDANGLKNGFVVLHISRFQQVLAILTFQGANANVKNTWLSKIRNAKDKWVEEWKIRSETREEKRLIKGRKKTL